MPSGRASYLNGIIEMAGGANIFRDAVAPYPKVGMEDVLARNPEVIVDMGDMSQTEGVTEEHKRSVVALWNRFPITCRRARSSRDCRSVRHLHGARSAHGGSRARIRPYTAPGGGLLSFRLDSVGMSYGRSRRACRTLPQYSRLRRCRPSPDRTGRANRLCSASWRVYATAFAGHVRIRDAICAAGRAGRSRDRWPSYRSLCA